MTEEAYDEPEADEQEFLRKGMAELREKYFKPEYGNYDAPDREVSRWERVLTFLRSARSTL